jgi:hypothetical protein
MENRSLQERLKAIYDHIQQSGFFIVPEQDLRFGRPLHKLEVAADNKTERTEFRICEESYNANLLFTLLGGVMNQTAQIAFGEPGTGKTTAAEFVGHFIFDEPVDKIQQATIYGHPEQTEEKMVAYLDIPSMMMGRKEVIVQDFMKTHTKLLDEFPRNPPGKQSIVLQLLDRGFAVYQSRRIGSLDGPIYLTANAPDAGSYPMLPPALDRNDAAVIALPLNPLYLTKITNDAHFIRSNPLGGDNSIEDKLSIPEHLRISNQVNEIRKEISETQVSPDALHRLIFFLGEINSCDRASADVERKSKGAALYRKPNRALCDGCHYSTIGHGHGHICRYTENPLTQRTYKAILAYTKALAWFRGKQIASAEDLEAVVPYCTWFKLKPTDAAFEGSDNQVFANDRLAFVRHLWEKSGEGYKRAELLLKEYDELLTTALKIDNQLMANKEEYMDKAKELMDSVAKLDSVAKFPLLVGLGNLYLAFHCAKGGPGACRKQS